MNSKFKKISMGLAVAGLFSLVACQSMEQGTGQKASANLESRSGSNA